MLALIIFLILLIFIFAGTPIAVALGLTSVGIFAIIGEADNLLIFSQRMYSATTGFTLLAIPFFIFAGNLMNTGGITNRIFRFAKSLVGHKWGGLGQVNVIASLIFSGMSGAAVADAAGLGMIEIKAMTDNGYDKEFSAAITAASSTIGPVVPPSIPFVIYGTMTGVSVASLFLAGFVPGFLMALTMIIVVYFISRRRKYPRYPKADIKERLISFKEAFLSLLTPIIIIGGILSGQFTPTEAAVIACMYALFLGMVVYKEIKWNQLIDIIRNTILHTIKVMFIISAAGFFGWFLTYLRLPQMVIEGLTSFTTNPVALMMIIIAILLIIGCFLEGIAVLLITIPVFMPIVAAIGMDPVQFGVVMILASMIGLLTPPVGMCLYAVSSISDVKIFRLSKEVFPYIIGIFIVLLAIAFIPALSLWLPSLLG
jgi:C4-dicarboxylate transporter, DctM subunit